MSSYNIQHATLSALLNNDKKQLQAQLAAELRTHYSNTSGLLNVDKTLFSESRKHSSATLLRKKLAGHLVREFNDI